MSKRFELPPLKAVLKYVREIYPVMLKASQGNMSQSLDQCLAYAEMTYNHISQIPDPDARSAAIESAYGDKATEVLKPIMDTTEKMQKAMARGKLMDLKHKVMASKAEFESDVKTARRKAEATAKSRERR